MLTCGTGTFSDGMNRIRQSGHCGRVSNVQVNESGCFSTRVMPSSTAASNCSGPWNVDGLHVLGQIDEGTIAVIEVDARIVVLRHRLSLRGFRGLM